MKNSILSTIALTGFLAISTVTAEVPANIPYELQITLIRSTLGDALGALKNGDSSSAYANINSLLDDANDVLNIQGKSTLSAATKTKAKSALANIRKVIENLSAAPTNAERIDIAKKSLKTLNLHLKQTKPGILDIYKTEIDVKQAVNFALDAIISNLESWIPGKMSVADLMEATHPS